MIHLFRELSPKRTYTKVYKNYRSYKPYLAKDFNECCGYTNCHHSWFGGMSNFHIDHFKAKSKYPEHNLRKRIQARISQSQRPAILRRPHPPSRSVH